MKFEIIRLDCNYCFQLTDRASCNCVSNSSDDI